MINAVRVLALGYSDGPTEGFVHAASGSCFFFKVIAWDRDQDRRLFALASVDPNLVIELEHVLQKRERLRTPIWAPSWRFKSKEDRKEADQLATRAIKSRSGPWELGLGVSPLALDAISPVSAAQEATVNEVVGSGRVEPLEKWHHLLQSG
jgi:hypothetical protein